MGTEHFAQMMGKPLDQWLVAPGPGQEGRRAAGRGRRSQALEPSVPQPGDRASPSRSSSSRSGSSGSRTASPRCSAAGRSVAAAGGRAMIGKTIADLAPGDTRRDHAAWSDDGDIAQLRRCGRRLQSRPQRPPTTRRRPSFKEPIAPGIFTAGLISAVIGTRLPGPGAIYLSQSLKFLKPVQARRHDHRAGGRARGRRASATACGSRPCARTSAARRSCRARRWVMPSKAARRLRATRRAPRRGRLACRRGRCAAAGPLALGTPGLALPRIVGAPLGYINSPPLIESSAPVM